MSELLISAVPGSMIDLIWNDVVPLIEDVKAKAPDDIDLWHTYKELKAGNVLLVIITRGSNIIAINVLDVQTLDTGVKVLYIPITSGRELDEWMEDFLKVAKEIGKQYGCKEMRGIAVRQGWLKKLKSHGWNEIFSTISCKIGED